MSLARNPAVAATLEAGIRAEQCARALRPDVACRPAQPIHHHDGGAGRAIVFLNGWTASGLVWPRDLIAALERDHRVIRVDNRGSGWSRHAPRPYTIADLAGDARRIIDDLGLGAATVVGLSMGGMIAQQLALRWPDRVGHLVLLATRPPSPEDSLPPAAVTASLLASPPKGVPLAPLPARRLGHRQRARLRRRPPGADRRDGGVHRPPPDAAVRRARPGPGHRRVGGRRAASAGSPCRPPSSTAPTTR